MVASQKEQLRQQISDYGILFIKGGWHVDKSEKPPHDYEGQKKPMINRAKSPVKHLRWRFLQK